MYVKQRVYQVDLARGLACLSMPIYHTIYNLYTTGIVAEPLTKNWFWVMYQKLGLGTFVFVSGMAFILSTQKGINWQRLSRRGFKLAFIAAAITLVTYFALPDKYVRFGVIHFFAVTILLAPLFRSWHKRAWALGAVILLIYWIVGRAGAFPSAWLYPTGLMSGRPSSVDYIPLIPWFGLFLIGMGTGHLLPSSSQAKPADWMRPIIWLGQHSLPFYLIHQVVVYGLLYALAALLG